MRHNSSPLLHILWDDSQIWGLIAARAARAMRLPHRLVRAGDVAGGLLIRERPSLLLAPGGNARHKAESLGPAGVGAIRDYVSGGGQYLGFCGGAGLALSWANGPAGRANAASGLGLCPWKRGAYSERMQHFMSGHLHMRLASTGEENAELIPDTLPAAPRLPVWWPGRFAGEAGDGIGILASYERPADDFWLADLPIAELPADVFSAWHDLYGLSFTPTFLAGQPCVLYGRHGKGGYLLSYSHLETPDSPDANQWLAHLFRRLGGLSPALDILPAWRAGEEPRWDDTKLHRLDALMQNMLRTGIRHGLLFTRTDWLMGWRSGLPGASINNLWSALRIIRENEPDDRAAAFWKREGERLSTAFAIFSGGCTQYLLAERLAVTLTKHLPDALPADMLKEQRDSLFGPPMHAGGLYRELMEGFDELAFLQLSGNA
jgi:hypothetical protein